ncbi:MAG: Ig-like domain-containing protein [Gammaproteobacteria bacterium]|nr:Ig-like domain-containing protein [Gammaproteobacteria bacterium]
MNLKNNIVIFTASVFISGCLYEDSSLEDLSSTPKAASFSIETYEDNVVDFQLAVTDREDDVREYFIEEQPSHGVISGVYPNLRYEPNPNYYGEDQFKYKVTDGSYDSNVATVTVRIYPVDDQPKIFGTPLLIVKTNEEYLFLPTASDIDSDNLTYSINNLPKWATFSESTGELKGIPSVSDISTFSNIVISVSDSNSTTELSPFSIEVIYNPWSSGTSMAKGRASLSVTNTGSKLFALAGYSDTMESSTDVYDVQTDTRTTKTPMNTPRNSFSSHVIGDKVFVIGGTNITHVLDSVEAYDITSDSWSVMASLQVPRTLHSSCVYDDKIFVFGGQSSVEHLASVEMYDPLSNTWVSKTAMETGNFSMSCATVDDSIFIFGGFFTENIFRIYKPLTDTWEAGGDLLTPRSAHFGAVNMNGIVYVFGGISNGSFTRTVQALNTSDMSWSHKSPMPDLRSHYGMVRQTTYYI